MTDLVSPWIPARSGAVQLRDLRNRDLDALFDQQRDPVFLQQLAFGAPDPNDRARFDSKWAGHIADPTITFWTILYRSTGDSEALVAGHVVSFCRPPATIREIGYSLGRKFWGRGIASAALGYALNEIEERPLCARCVSDNYASKRVLKKHGFHVVGFESHFANARNRVVEETLFRLGQ